jgi:trimethylamine--corrinoid protein Co-methyltransferase
MELIKKLGTSGNYLVEPHTARRCRSEFFIPDLNIRTIHSKWLEMEPRAMDQRASQLLEKRLSAYEKPDIDPLIENDLIKYVENKKQ